MKSPFFILGCVRSGTTLLRNLLRQHPNLACPEETHFFRWPFAYAGADFQRIQENNPTLQAHRKMDGIAESSFSAMLGQAKNRRELQDTYAAAYLEGLDEKKSRWFDKTPQNAYGLLLLSAYYPDAKFIHLHRHPFNVIASLKAGKVMGKHTLLAAINTWLESVAIVREYRNAQPDRVYELSYEKLTTDPQSSLDDLLQYVEESPANIDWQGIVHAEQNKYREMLDDDELDQIRRMLGAMMEHYGYV